MDTVDLHPRTAVVAGAGPAGSVAALLLADRGIAVTLLARTAEGADDGALVLEGEGRSVLESLGLLGQLEMRGAPVGPNIVRDRDGRPIRRGFDHGLAVRTADLIDVLDRAIAVHPGISVRHSEVLEVSRDGDVWFASDDEVHHIVADIVVAADGTRSSVRNGGDFGARLRRTARFYVSGMASFESDAVHGEFWTSLGAFGVTSLGDGTIFFYADVTSDESAAAVGRGDTAALIDVWRRALPAAADVIDRIDPTDRLRLTERTIVQSRRFSDGRIALIGDAAHAMGPTPGDDVNRALGDAAALTLQLGIGDDLATALARYDALRRPAMHAAQRAASRHASWSGLRSAFGRAACRLGVSSVDGRPQAMLAGQQV